MNKQTDEHIFTSPEEVILDSRTIELNKYFGEVDSLPQLLVLVEDEDDKPFWHKVFSSCVGSFYSSIDVWPLKEAAEKELPQTDVSGEVLTATGKDSLMKVAGLGRNKMVAVDADYDLLIDNVHDYTERVRSDRYVLHTIYHSVENHLLENETILSRPELSILSNEIEDYVYGVIGEHMFHIQQTTNGTPHTYAITVEKLRSDIGSLQYHHQSYVQDLRNLIATKLANVTPTTLPKYQDARTMCASNGYNSNNLWQIIQGHTLYEYMFKVVTSEMVRERQEKEAAITNDNSISGTKKGEKIQELKRTLLGDFNNEKEKFRNDVYNGAYMDMTSSSIQSIQQKILNDLDIEVS